MHRAGREVRVGESVLIVVRSKSSPQPNPHTANDCAIPIKPDTAGVGIEMDPADPVIDSAQFDESQLARAICSPVVANRTSHRSS